MMLAIFLSGRQQFIQRYKNHDAGHPGKENAEDKIAEKIKQNRISDQGTDGFGDSGKKGIVKSLSFASGGIINRNRDRNALRDIMDGNGNRYGQTQCRI